MTPKDVLTGAKAALLDRGLFRGNYCQNLDGSGPVCLYGALRIGVGNGPNDFVIGSNGPSFDGALEALYKHIDDTISGYNDAPGRTIDEILAVLDLAISNVSE